MIIAAVIFAVLLTAAVLLFFFLHPQEALLPGEFSSQMREMGYTVYGIGDFGAVRNGRSR